MFRKLFLILALYPCAILLLGLTYIAIPPVSTLMLGRWLTFQTAERDWVPLERISPHIQRAVIGSEDAKFCDHHGVDWEALRKVMEEADEDGPSRGASTIPMQVAKNLFLSPHRSYFRKAIEIPTALYLDAIWPKTRMMEIYLNIAEWGVGIFGIEAASQHYFNKSAANLTKQEAALLAATLPYPTKRNPANQSRGYQKRTAKAAARMNSANTRCL